MAPALALPRWLEEEVGIELASQIKVERWKQRGPHGLAFGISQALADLVDSALGPAALDQLTEAAGDPLDESGPLVRRLERVLRAAYDPTYPDTVLLEDLDARWLRKSVMHALGAAFVPPPSVPVPAALRGPLATALRVSLENRRQSSTSLARVLVATLKQFAVEHKQTALLENIARGAAEDPTSATVLARQLQRLGFRNRGTVAEWRSWGVEDLVEDELEEDRTIDSPEPICVLGEGDLRALEDILARLFGIEWIAPATPLRLVVGDPATAREYRLTERFAVGESIRHARFGLGVVTERTETTIAVQFDDGVRKLHQGG